MASKRFAVSALLLTLAPALLSTGAAASGASDGESAGEVRALLRSGRPVEARRAALALLAANPDDPTLLVLAGDVSRAAGAEKAAEDLYGRAFTAAGHLPPDRKAPRVFAAAANGLAVLRLQAGDALGAVKVLAFAYLHYPDDRDTLTNLGLGYSVLAEWDQAERFLKRALAAAPGDICAETLLGEVARLRAGTGSDGGDAIEVFTMTGSAGRRAAWGLVMAALVRGALVDELPGKVPAGLRVGGTVRELESELWVTVRAVRSIDGTEVASFSVKAPSAGGELRRSLREQMPLFEEALRSPR